MLVMISPVPFLFSLFFFLSLGPPLFCLEIERFPPSLPLPLLTPGCWGEGAGGGGGE